MLQRQGTCLEQWQKPAAFALCSIMDIPVSIKDIKSSGYGSNVQRPAYSVLENYMLKLTNGYVFPDWKDALKEYLNNL